MYRRIHAVAPAGAGSGARLVEYEYRIATDSDQIAEAEPVVPDGRRPRRWRRRTGNRARRGRRGSRRRRGAAIAATAAGMRGDRHTGQSHDGGQHRRTGEIGDVSISPATLALPPPRRRRQGRQQWMSWPNDLGGHHRMRDEKRHNVGRCEAGEELFRLVTDSSRGRRVVLRDQFDGRLPGARRLHLPPRQSIAVSLEIGLHIAMLAMGIALSPQLLNSTEMATPAAVYGFFLRRLIALAFVFTVRRWTRRLEAPPPPTNSSTEAQTIT